MTPQFADDTLLSNLFDIANFVFKFSYWFKVHVSDKGIDQKSRNRKYPCLCFA